MIKPSHALPQRLASEIFTDREDARARFTRALDDAQPAGDYRVLAWYGVGGQGKSALQAEFGRMIDRARGNWVNVRKRRLASALVDLENPANRNPAQALLSVRLQLAEHGAMRFPAFDLAFARYFSLDQPGKDIRAVHPELFKRGGEVLADVLSLASDVANVIPGYGLLTKYGAKLAAHGAEALQIWWDRRGRSVMAGMDELSVDQLASALPKYLGYDLCEAVAAPESPRIVIRFDTHEALWRDRGLKDGPGALLVDDWLRRLVQDTPGALVVITGRDRLRWGAIDHDWDSIVEQHLLGGLSDEDASAFLIKVGVEDPAVRARMIAAARGEEGEGCLPYYLDLERETHDAVVAAGQTPTPNQFGGGRTEILARFLAHLDPETERRLRMASYPETLDSDSLAILSREFLKEPDAEGWKRLLGRAFIEHPVDGPPILHALTRSTLQASEREEHWDRFRDIHMSLWQQAEGRMTKPDQPVSADDERLFLTAISHMVALGSARSAQWGLDRLGRFRDAARSRTVETAANRLMPFAREHAGPGWAAAIMSWQAAAASDLGRFPQAEELFRQAMQAYTDLYGPDHAQTLVCAANLAGALADLGRAGEAEALYTEVIGQQTVALGENHPDVGVSLHNLGRVYSDQGRLREAVSLMERALAISLAAEGPDHLSTAQSQANLASVLADLGAYDEAQELVDRALATQARFLAADHPHLWLTRTVAAWITYGRRQYAEAEELYRTILGALEASLGPNHLSSLATRMRMARAAFKAGRLDTARRLFDDVLDRFAASNLPDLPVLGHALAGRAVVRADQGEAVAAVEDLRRARDILAGFWDADHPNWFMVEMGEASLNARAGRNDAAREQLQRARRRLVEVGTYPGEAALLEIDKELERLDG